jgi:hypothetical protein
VRPPIERVDAATIVGTELVDLGHQIISDL